MVILPIRAWKLDLFKIYGNSDASMQWMFSFSDFIDGQNAFKDLKRLAKLLPADCFACPLRIIFHSNLH